MKGGRIPISPKPIMLKVELSIGLLSALGKVDKGFQTFFLSLIKFYGGRISNEEMLFAILKHYGIERCEDFLLLSREEFTEDFLDKIAGILDTLQDFKILSMAKYTQAMWDCMQYFFDRLHYENFTKPYEEARLKSLSKSYSEASCTHTEISEVLDSPPDTPLIERAPVINIMPAKDYIETLPIYHVDDGDLGFSLNMDDIMDNEPLSRGSPMPQANSTDVFVPGSKDSVESVNPEDLATTIVVEPDQQIFFTPAEIWYMTH